MEKFRMDNTEGYSQEQLDELNEQYEKRILDYERRHNFEIDPEEEQHIAEDVQRHYDYGLKCDFGMAEFAKSCE